MYKHTTVRKTYIYQTIHCKCINHPKLIVVNIQLNDYYQIKQIYKQKNQNKATQHK